jgi:antitoxin component YwqK of YwqJK toxin-antitoxin module
MKNIISLLILLTALELGAQTMLIFKNDTLVIYDNDSIYYRKGDDINGEIKYGRNEYYQIIQVQDGYISNWKSYFQNGALRSEYNFKYGKQHGPYNEWYETGTLMVTGHYRDGYQDGLWTYYFSNGVKESEGRFLADTDHLIKDFQTHFNRRMPETGEITQVVMSSPVHSPPDGEWKFYNKRGTLMKTFTFDKGTIVSMEFGDHRNN